MPWRRALGPPAGVGAGRKVAVSSDVGADRLPQCPQPPMASRSQQQRLRGKPPPGRSQAQQRLAQGVQLPQRATQAM